MVMINIPFKPDLAIFYEFGMCELCTEEKNINSNFDNSKCPHCAKKTKVMHYGKKQTDTYTEL